MKQEISIEELLAPTGIDEEEIRDRAESDDIELSEQDVRKIARSLSADEDLSVAKHEALGRALDKVSDL